LFGFLVVVVPWRAIRNHPPSHSAMAGRGAAIEQGSW